MSSTVAFLDLHFCAHRSLFALFVFAYPRSFCLHNTLFATQRRSSLFSVHRCPNTLLCFLIAALSSQFVCLPPCCTSLRALVMAYNFLHLRQGSCICGTLIASSSQLSKHTHIGV